MTELSRRVAGVRFRSVTGADQFASNDPELINTPVIAIPAKPSARPSPAHHERQDWCVIFITHGLEPPSERFVAIAFESLVKPNVCRPLLESFSVASAHSLFFVFSIS